MSTPRLQMSDSGRREMARHHQPDCVCVWCKASRSTIKPPSTHPLTDAITLAHALDTSGATRRETAYFDHACRMEEERKEGGSACKASCQSSPQSTLNLSHGQANQNNSKPCMHSFSKPAQSPNELTQLRSSFEMLAAWMDASPPHVGSKLIRRVLSGEVPPAAGEEWEAKA